jgi:RNA polymerase sigma-70 factor (ECF subfamily)
VARDQALAALHTLSPKEAEAVTLTAWHGLEPAEAAQVAGCSRDAFVVRLHRGRSRLARALDTSHEPGPEAPEHAPRPRVIPEKS